MLNFLLLVLVVVNAGLFAYQQGALASFFPEEHEPTRLSQQLNPDRIQVLSLPGAEEPSAAAEGEGEAEDRAQRQAAENASPQATPGPAASQSAAAGTERPAAVQSESAPPAGEQASATPTAALASTPASTPATPVSAPTPRIACYAVSNLNPTTARRFETQLARLKLGVQPSRQEVSEAGSHMVLYPPQGSRAAAEKKVEELRQAGVTELYVLGENSAHPWGISLGVFRAEEAARVQLANLALKGVQGATLAPHAMTLKAVTLQFRNIDDDTRARIAQLASRFDTARSASCN